MSSVVNVCFHGIGTPGRALEDGEQAYWIDERLFGDALDLLAGRTDVALSFDDGNASDVRIALPALLERNLRGAFYPVVARVGSRGSVEASGLRELVAAGMTIGSHGMTHRPWRGLSDAELDVELVDARERIAEITGSAVDLAACPLGSYDRHVLSRLRRLGYRRVFTSDRAVARDGGWLQPRFSVRSSDDITSLTAILDRRPSCSRRALTAARIAVKRLR